MQNMIVRLTPWAAQRILSDYIGLADGQITVAAIRQSLRDVPGTEFHTVSTPTFPRNGVVVDVKSALIDPGGFDQIEVRFNNDQDLAIIVVDRDGQVVVR